jgi:hypothetical protein
MWEREKSDGDGDGDGDGAYIRIYVCVCEGKSCSGRCEYVSMSQKARSLVSVTSGVVSKAIVARWTNEIHSGRKLSHESPRSK